MVSRSWTDVRTTTECEDRARILETEFATKSHKAHENNWKSTLKDLFRIADGELRREEL